MINEEPGQMCWGKPSILLFNLMSDVWSVGTVVKPFEDVLKLFLPQSGEEMPLDALWEKAPLTAISPMETCAQIMMFALNI